jgi:hypothetical protein
MSLPVGQRRALNGIEGALKAGEPHLASMFVIFARLSQDEPVSAEPLVPSRPRWLRPGTAVSAIALVPVMFAAIVIGALLGGSARGATTCDASYRVGGSASLLYRPSCLRPQATTLAQPVPRPSGTGALSCASSVPAGRFTVANGGKQALSPPARAGTMTAGLSRIC